MSLRTNEIENLFMFIGHLDIFFCEGSIQSFAHFSIGLSVFFVFVAAPHTLNGDDGPLTGPPALLATSSLRFLDHPLVKPL